MQKCVFALAFFVSHVPSKKAFGDFVHFASCFFRSAFRPGSRRLQTAKKVPSSRHVRMDGTHTGKLSAESVRGRKAECAVQRSILSPGGYQGEGISVLRSRQKWVPPGAWRFCDTLRPPGRSPPAAMPLFIPDNPAAFWPGWGGAACAAPLPRSAAPAPA